MDTLTQLVSYLEHWYLCESCLYMRLISFHVLDILFNSDERLIIYLTQCLYNQTSTIPNTMPV